MARSSAVCLVCALILAVRSGPGGAEAQQLRSQIALYTTTVTWIAEPYTPVVAELHGRDGIKADGAEVADNAHKARVRLASPGRPEDAVIGPGDVIVVRAGTTPAVTVTVPTLAADLDASENRLVGVAPPGASLELEVTTGGEAIPAVVTADASGRFGLDLGPVRRLAPGDSGQVRYVGNAGDEFLATAVVFDATVTLGRTDLRARVGAGSELVADVQAPGLGDASVTFVPVRPFVLSSTFEVRMTGLPRLVPGTELRLTRRSPVPGHDETVSVTIPDLTVPIERDGREVHGRLPPGATAVVELGDALATTGYRPTAKIPVTAGADGKYQAALPPDVVLKPGWRAQLRYEPLPRMALVAESVLRQYTVVWRGTEIQGVVSPSNPITVTLAQADGRAKGTAATDSASTGKFSVTFGSIFQGDASILILPGDHVTVHEASLGDPIVIDVPDLTVVTDAATDRVYGQAPPGLAVAVSTASPTVVRGFVDAGGHYEASFAGIEDIAPGGAGGVSFSWPDGREFVTGWSAQRLSIGLSGKDDDDNYVVRTGINGNGTAGRLVRVTARSPAGRHLATHEMLLDQGGQIWSSRVARASYWQLSLADWTGAGVDLQKGDTLEVTAGDDRVVVPVPRLEAVCHVDIDQVTGVTEPGAEVSCGVRRNGVVGASDPITATADGAGRFLCDFGGKFDLQYRDNVFVMLRIDGGHDVTRFVQAPGLLLDLNEATLSGTVSPATPLRVELRHGPTVIWSENENTGREGTFVAALRDSGAEPLVPAAGDEIVVWDISRAATILTTMTVPELSIDIRRNEALVRGRATPGGALSLEAVNLYNPQGQQGVQSNGWAAPVIAPDGRYEAPTALFNTGGIDLRPGTDMRARYRLPVGHMVRLSEPVPMVNVQHGGPHVCGRARGRAPVAIQLVDASGALRATGSGRAGADRRFALTLRAPGGEPVTTRPGDRVLVDTSGESIAVDLPPIAVAVNWSSPFRGRGALYSVVSGTVRPLTTYYIETPADGCFGGAIPYFVYTGDTDRDGHFSRTIDPPGMGDGIQVAFFTADWHRIYTQIFRAQAQVYVHTDRVAGHATPATTVEFTLTGAAGAVRARATAVADLRGAFDTRLRDARGESVVMDPGDHLIMVTDEGRADILVEELTFDFSPTRGVVGRTEPSRDLDGRFVFPGDEVATVTLTSDLAGGFVFTPDDMPDRSPWTLADLQRLRLALPVAGGHEMVAEIVIGSRPRAVVHLPFALVPRPSR